MRDRTAQALFLQTPAQIGGLIATIVVCGMVVRSGPAKARKAAIGAMILFGISPLVQNWADLQGPQWGLLVVDGLYLAYLIRLLGTGSGWWLRGMIAAQVLAVAAHLNMVVNALIGGRAYLSSTYLVWFVLLIALAMSVPFGGCRRRRV